MQYRSVKGFTGWSQLGILLVFFGLGFIMAAAVQLLIGIQLIPSGIPADKVGEEIMKAIMKPENTGYARLAQVLGTFCLLCIPAVFFLFICHGRNIFWLGFNKQINGWQILIGFFLIFFANIVAGPLEEFSKNILAHFPDLDKAARSLENNYSEQVAALSNLRSWGEFGISLVIMAFFPALFEEVFFRGVLQNTLERWWKIPLLAVIVTSILFSVIHMSVYLFLSRVVLGFVLGLMYQRCKNLWVNIIAHFLNNAVALVQLFWMTRHDRKIELDKIDPKFPLWSGLIAIAITYGLFLLFEKLSAKNRNLVANEERVLREKTDSFNPFSTTSNS